MLDHPDHVYAYTVETKNRLEGRGIALIGIVKSYVGGKANFKCDNGHNWRATPRLVGEGDGCPRCGMGTDTDENIRKRIKAGVMCLLTNPQNPRCIKIGISYTTIKGLYKNYPWNDWAVLKYRNVDDVGLAEEVIKELLEVPSYSIGDEIEMDIENAEEKFRRLIYVMREQIADSERKRISEFSVT